MRLVIPAVGVVVCLTAFSPGAAPTAWARSKPPAKKPGGTEVGSDHTLEKQSAWEQKVMGDDGAKRADMKKIAAAQKLSDEARKNPPPEPPKKHKDPNKEGARAKSEATIGLPIASDETSPVRRARPSAPAGKKATRSGPANDEVGALVATSLAEDRKGTAASAPAPRPSGAGGTGRGGKGRGKRGKGSAGEPAPSSLDRMFSAGAGK